MRRNGLAEPQTARFRSPSGGFRCSAKSLRLRGRWPLSLPVSLSRRGEERPGVAKACACAERRSCWWLSSVVSSRARSLCLGGAPPKLRPASKPPRRPGGRNAGSVGGEGGSQSGAPFARWG